VNRRDGDISIFVDNLPLDMNPRWLRRIFGWFGEVTDVFIPNKFRKGVGTKFGFVRFCKRGEAMLAVRRCKGACLGNFRLIVNIVAFGRRRGEWRIKQGVVNDLVVEPNKEKSSRNEGCLDSQAGPVLDPGEQGGRLGPLILGQKRGPQMPIPILVLKTQKSAQRYASQLSNWTLLGPVLLFKQKPILPSPI